MNAGLPAEVRVGCAGWSLPRSAHEHFPLTGSHLERYAARLPAVEINSSFYRPHRHATYARWAASVPATFRFSVKIPKSITHENVLKDPEEKLDSFLAGVAGLGEKLGCLLVQLPPSLAFDAIVARDFFAALRGRHGGAAVLEPRHASWAAPECENLLDTFRVARVAADPARIPCGNEPRGWRGVAYYRLHGTPRVYFSAYSGDYLDALAADIAARAQCATPVWCVFDNTGLGAAAGNAIGLLDRLAPRDAKAVDRAES
jgi:uncharacterized protein YecE (DUF72 family)